MSMRISVLSFILLAVSLAGCIIAVIPACRKSFVRRFSPIWRKRFFWIMVGAAFVVGLGVRVWQFGIVPTGFNQDEAMAGLDAMALARHGTDRFGTWLPAYFYAWGYGQMSVLMSYLMVPFIWMFGLSVTVARLPMLLVSLAGMYVLFRFAQKVGGNKLALIMLCLVAVNPWQIMQSRWALDCNMLPHFLLFGFYFLYLGLRQRRWYLYLSMVFFALTMYTYGIAFYTIPVLMVALCIYLLCAKRVKWWETLICAAIFIAVAAGALCVMVVNLFGLDTIETPIFTAQLFSESIRTGDLVWNADNVYDQLAQNLYQYARLIWLQLPDEMCWNSIADYGLTYIFSLPLVAFGVYESLRTFKRDNLATTLLIIWTLLGLFAGAVARDVNINRINIAIYPIIIFSGIGLYGICRRCNPMVLLFTALYAFSFFGFSQNYFGPNNEMFAWYFFEGFDKAIHRASDSEVIYVSTTFWGTPSYEIAELLTQFHDEVDAEYARGEGEQSRNGVEWKPYIDRYQYIYMAYEQFFLSTEPNCVYVVASYEASYFDPEFYDIEYYTQHAVIWPKGIE